MSGPAAAKPENQELKWDSGFVEHVWRPGQGTVLDSVLDTGLGFHMDLGKHWELDWSCCCCWCWWWDWDWDRCWGRGWGPGRGCSGGWAAGWAAGSDSGCTQDQRPSSWPVMAPV